MRGRRVTILFFSILLTSQLAVASSSRSHAEEDYANDPWSLAVGGTYTTTVLKHNETSTSPSFATSGRRVRVPESHLSLLVMREFLNKATYSFTLLFKAGVNDSSGQSGGLDGQVTMEESLKSSHFAAGGSVNYSLYKFGLKIQPYLGVGIIQESGEFTLQYSNGGTTIDTIHSFNSTLAVGSLGVRFFNADANLMSYFQLSVPTVMNANAEARAKTNGVEVPVASNTAIVRDPVAFSLGFGYYF